MNNQYFDILNQQYKNSRIWLTQTFNCFVCFAVLELVGIIVIDGIQTVDMSVIYVPVNLIPNGVEQANTLLYENVLTAIIRGGFTFLKLFVFSGIFVYLFKLVNIFIQFNDGRQPASALIPTTVRFILAVSLFFMIPMGEDSALYLLNTYNLKIEHVIQNDYSERLKAYQTIPNNENWEKIEPLFSIDANKPYLNYIKSATGDKESINRAVQDFQSGKLHLHNNDRYICALEQKADRISKRSESCAEYVDWIENIWLIVEWVGRIIALLLVFCLARYIGIYKRVKCCAEYQMMELK